MPAKYSEKDVVEICSNNGITYVNGYKSNRQKFNCICSCGNDWFVRLDHIRYGMKCGRCTSGVLRTSEEISEELVKYGFKLLQPYIGALIPIIYLCSCEGVGKSVIGSIRKGHKCGHCIEMKWREYFRDYNCEIIRYITSTEVTYRCSCGEIVTTNAQNFKTTDKKCPTCRINHRYTNMPIKGRKNLISWKIKVVNRDNFECQLCHTDCGLEIHHIEAYHLRPELADDIDNGITLCHDCHVGLHYKYGYNVGRENLKALI
jgi:hypothetical protein